MKARRQNSFRFAASRSDPSGTCLDEPSGIPFGQFRLSSYASPRRVPRCFVHAPLKEPCRLGGKAAE